MKVRLKDLGTIFTGNTPSKRVDEYWDNSDIKFIKPDIIKDELCVISSANEYISAGAKNASRIVPANSVLVTCIGNIGRVGITEEEVAFNQQINAIVPNRTIIPKYLAYAIYANRKQLQAIANAPVVPIINKTQFSDFEISICESLEKQNKIVRILDTISEIITHNKKKIEALDDLIKARFVEMFGDGFETTELRNICRVTSGGTPSTKNSDYYNGTIPWVTTTALGPNHIDDTKAKAYISEEAVANSATKIIPSGSILFGIRVGVGKTSINDVDICTNQDIVAILDIDEKKFSKLFIKHVLDANRAHYDSLKKGATILGITSDDLKNTPIPLVPIKAQKDFEVFVAQVDKSKFALQNSIINLMNLWYNTNSMFCERTYGEA